MKLLKAWKNSIKVRHFALSAVFHFYAKGLINLVLLQQGTEQDFHHKHLYVLSGPKSGRIILIIYAKTINLKSDVNRV